MAARGSPKVLPAGELRVGEHFLMVRAEDGSIVASAVTALGEVSLPGFAAPLTVAGSLFVEGVFDDEPYRRL